VPWCLHACDDSCVPQLGVAKLSMNNTHVQTGYSIHRCVVKSADGLPCALLHACQAVVLKPVSCSIVA
jgi:hypothetical protein